MEISKTILSFVEEAKKQFAYDKQLTTYRDWNESLIALRTGEDRDTITVFKLDSFVADFTEQLEPCPFPREAARDFAISMEKQLAANDHKTGWKREHHQDLSGAIFYHTEMLRKELIKSYRDETEVTKRCANIANYAMMIAENEGKPL